MVLSLFHDPPPFMPSTLQTVSVALSLRCTIRRERPAKYPRDWLSGDQNGLAAPSVPLMGVERRASRGPSHSVRCPSGPCAEKTRLRPSGDTAGEPGKAVCSG